MNEKKNIELDLSLIQFRLVKNEYIFFNLISMFIPRLGGPRSFFGYFRNEFRISLDILFITINIEKE